MQVQPRESLVEYDPPIEINQNSDLARLQNLGGKKRTQYYSLKIKKHTIYIYLFKKKLFFDVHIYYLSFYLNT